MARVTRRPSQMSQAPWAADYLSRDHLVPTTAMLDLAAFGGVAPVSGTAVGRSADEVETDAPYRPAAAGDAETFLLAFNASEHGDAVLYRPNSTVRTNFLPGFADLAPEVQAAIRSTYVCIKGAA